MRSPAAQRDLDACERALREGSRSFHAASRLLPARVRAHTTALYAFCRAADDAIDARPGATAAAVEVLRARLDGVFDGRPADGPADRALAVVVEEVSLPRAPLDALLEGLAWDTEGRRYETLDDLYAYAARVAGTVGAMMTLVMGSRDPRTLARACDLGVAMQLTNIARDVGEDAARGRLYLPLAWLRAAEVDADAWLLRPSFAPALGGVVADLLARAEALYRRAETGIPELPADCRRAVYAARLVYAAIGREIAHAGYDSVSRRAVVPTWRKALLLARSLGLGNLAGQADPQPPLEATRFLVRACAAS